MKFVRRPDLTSETRLYIAIMAYLQCGLYGTITKLGNKYNVSRKFVYQQLWALQVFMNAQLNPLPVMDHELWHADPERLVKQLILLLRLEGKCSLQSISNILAALGLTPHSVGMISQCLSAYAQVLPSTLSSEPVQFVLFLSDELFANGRPILITVEPRSAAILRLELADDRSAESWQAHWIEIERNQFYSLGLVSDRGAGLSAGFESLHPDLPHQFDLFHDLRDLSRAMLVKLETLAYQAIDQEYRAWAKLDSARSERVINARIEAYENAVKTSQEAMTRYDDARILFDWLQQTLQVFDAGGRPKTVEQVRLEIQAILDMLAAYPVESLQEAVKDLKNHLDSLLTYFDRAQTVCQQLQTQVTDPQVLQALCLAWQWEQQVHQAASAARKRHCQHERDFWRAYAEGRLDDESADSQALQKQVFEQLDTIVRASSLVEMVNSLIRPYLNTCKGQITQEMLALIMFYHNHRPFNGGKRKGQAPIEILTGKPLEKQWLNLLVAA
jgi:hypothetical protein